MFIYRIRSKSRDGTVYLCVSNDSDIALRDLARQVGKPLTFEAGEHAPEYMMSKNRVIGGEDAEPEYTIPVYTTS